MWREEERDRERRIRDWGMLSLWYPRLGPSDGEASGFRKQGLNSEVLRYIRSLTIDFSIFLS